MTREQWIIASLLGLSTSLLALIAVLLVLNFFQGSPSAGAQMAGELPLPTMAEGQSRMAPLTPGIYISILLLFGVVAGIASYVLLGRKAYDDPSPAKAGEFTHLFRNLLQLLTVALLIGAVIILAVDDKIEATTSGPLLGAIAGYVLHDLARTVMRPRQNGEGGSGGP
ncbi:MAG: hypothetical protein IH830_01390 [Planctomycetes bacterium]|nr:hypothetical protein [Planctomycetota bacterium]